MVKPTFNGSLMFPSDYVAAEDLLGKDVNVKIVKIEKAKLKTNDGKQKDAYLIYFEGKNKPLVLNKTNARTIAGILGPAAEKWVGKRITLYPTTCEAFGQTTTCIRVRDRAPDDTRKPAEGFPDNNDDPIGDGMASKPAAPRRSKQSELPSPDDDSDEAGLKRWDWLKAQCYAMTGSDRTTVEALCTHWLSGFGYLPATLRVPKYWLRVMDRANETDWTKVALEASIQEGIE